MNIDVREEHPGDEAAIRAANDQAFGQDLEGRIVEALRSNGVAKLSLVATHDDQIVGHIMFSPASIDGMVQGAALGPMAVVPAAQGQGVGSRLVQAGIKQLEKSGCPFIIVLGHADYYPRFGFQPASARGIACKWEVPDEAFMILVFDEKQLEGATGMAQYRNEFSTIT